MNLNREIASLKTIISKYDSFWMNPKKARALLMDYYSDNKPFCHALVSCVELSMPSEIRGLDYCSRTEYYRLVKRLTNEYGYSNELAEKVVTVWLEAFGVSKEIENDSLNRKSKDFEFLQGEFVGKYIGISKYNERIIECDNLWYAMIPFDLIMQYSFKIDMLVQFHAVMLGRFRYAYDIKIIDMPDRENNKIQIPNSGMDVIRRKGVIESLESGIGIVYEEPIKQRYQFWLTRSENKNNYSPGDPIDFSLSVADGRLLATDIIK